MARQELVAEIMGAIRESALDAVRRHEIAVLDAAESLAVRRGPAAVTARAVAAATGISNGAIYHTFGSRAELLGRTWLRAARRFLDLQTTLVQTALGSHDEVEAVVAAAEAPAIFVERHLDSSRLLLAVRREELLGELPESVAAELAATGEMLIELMTRLSQHLWQRGDRRAVDAITLCLVDLPTAVLLRRERLADPHARNASAAPCGPCSRSARHPDHPRPLPLEDPPCSSVRSALPGEWCSGGFGRIGRCRV